MPSLAALRNVLRTLVVPTENLNMSRRVALHKLFAYIVTPYSANDSPPKEPEYVKVSGSSQAPVSTAGPYSTNKYPRGKDQEYTVPVAGKQ